MFKKAVFKLTFFYSFFFFFLFWTFSLGLYVYLERSLQKEFVTQVSERVRHEFQGAQVLGFSEFSIQHSNTLLNKSREMTLENFRRGLVLVNCLFLFLIPAVSWFLAKRTLSPIQDILQKQKQFVSDASHELRTPLGIAANEIEIALQQERNTSYYRKTLSVLKEEILRLSNLVLNLLTLARHENAGKEIGMQEVALADIISTVIATYRQKSLAQKVLFKVNFPDENIVVKGNPTMLEQLFTNLIDNAIKFSLPERTVTVSIRKKRKHAEVLIQDEGAGIAFEEQKKIFDRFYRSDSSRVQAGGFGLGLSIAKMVAESHGGSISVHSALGKGSTFIVTLPFKA
jgi:two-component system sensor histidine kinase CiaH